MHSETADRFLLTSVRGGTSLEFSGEIPRGLTGYDEAEFIVRLSSDHLTATARMTDVQPHRWAEFFMDLAANWKGWSGPKEHESFENHLKLSCTTDSTGHVELRVSLRGDISDSNWRAENSIFLEAGQLENIAEKARRYFGS